ncbi:MAG: flagellar basal body-associated FliL family protein [Acidimicrobiales bacterium]
MGLGKKKKDQGDDSGTDTPKKAKSNLIPAIIIAIGLVAGAKVMGGGGGSTNADPTPTTLSTTTTVPDGEKIKLEPVTLNVSDGRFLKVGITLQLRHDPKGGAGHGADPKEDAAKTWAKALDLTIEVLGGRTYEELVTPAGREHAKGLLVERLEKAFHGEIETVYFTEFVMQ